MVKVSIIVPVYNTRNYVSRLLSSIENQTFKDWELILVDDHSNDGTYELLLEFKDRYPDKVDVLRTPRPRSSPMVGKNIGIEVSSGKFLAFIDSDDWWSETFLEDTVSNMDGVDGACTEYYDVFEKNGKSIHVKFSKRGEVSWKDVLKLKVRFGNGNSLLRRNIVENYGIRFPPELWYSEDVYFYSQYLSVADRVYAVPKPHFYHLVREVSMVQGKGDDPEKKLKQTLRVYREVCERIEEISKKSEEICKLLERYGRPYSVMIYITAISDSYGREYARSVFWKYLGYVSSYRPTNSHWSKLTLLWMLDLFIPVRGLLRNVLK
jgi:teichuronic acid biosynthesis glycosyltransferase TuaG